MISEPVRSDPWTGYALPPSIKEPEGKDKESKDPKHLSPLSKHITRYFHNFIVNIFEFDGVFAAQTLWG